MLTGAGGGAEKELQHFDESMLADGAEVCDISYPLKSCAKLD